MRAHLTHFSFRVFFPGLPLNVLSITYFFCKTTKTRTTTTDGRFRRCRRLSSAEREREVPVAMAAHASWTHVWTLEFFSEVLRRQGQASAQHHTNPRTVSSHLLCVSNCTYVPVKKVLLYQQLQQRMRHFCSGANVRPLFPISPVVKNESAGISSLSLLCCVSVLGRHPAPSTRRCCATTRPTELKIRCCSCRRFT